MTPAAQGGPLRVPALLVAAPASGQGKTTAAAALARLHARRGRRVRAFKAGADFIDPGILERACGAPVYQLDLWLAGEAECRRRVFDAAADADLILVEGAMGLHDGQPSCADLAAALGLPVLLVVDAAAMAQTFGAVCLGLATYRADIEVAGVLANRVAGERHARLLRQSLPARLAYFGALPECPAAALPERHLGLAQAGEIGDLDARIDAAADALAGTAAAELPAPVALASAPPAEKTDLLLEGVRIGVARDAAFSFIHPANLDLLRSLGAELAFFSPLADARPPEADALWLPGGYPELHLGRLAANGAMRARVREHHAAGRPLLAECGGLLYLLEALAAADGARGEMAGVLPGHAILQERLAAIGPQSVEFRAGELRGHTFHHSRLVTPLAPSLRARSPHGGPGEAVYHVGRTTASYVHFYFPSNPFAAAALFSP
ncbi:MAG TPA: cobyrinate a,c-diamide synthase [Pelomicrobium sp.]|nr:cobyrinate a,c-diamide synthase [Pelomicrobium sp.]